MNYNYVHKSEEDRPKKSGPKFYRQKPYPKIGRVDKEIWQKVTSSMVFHYLSTLLK